MQHHGSKYFARRPPPLTLGWSQKVKIHFFQNMVMLHIKLKGITKCSNMVANILPADPPTHTHTHDPRGWGQKVKIQLFQNMVMLLIKLKGISNAASWLQTFGQQIIPPSRTLRMG